MMVGTLYSVKLRTAKLKKRYSRAQETSPDPVHRISAGPFACLNIMAEDPEAISRHLWQPG